VLDPNGGINSLWPLFGIANQLLAVIALSLGTTVLIKMHRQRYVWVTLGPLVWLVSVTFTAGIQKIFGTWPKGAFGFLDIAADRSAKLAAGGTEAQMAKWQAEVFNNHLNAGVAALFLVFVAVIVLGCLREWWRLLYGKREVVLHEGDYVALPEDGARL
jgi:carbon starvation protein